MSTIDKMPDNKNKIELIKTIDHKIDQLIDSSVHNDNLVNIKSIVLQEDLTYRKLEYLKNLIDLVFTYDISIHQLNSAFNESIYPIDETYKKGILFYSQIILAIVFFISITIGILFI